MVGARPVTSSPDSVVAIGDFEPLAAAALPRDVLDYVASGACDGSTLRRNVDAFDDWQILPRVLVDVSSIDLATAVLGAPLALPVMVAPVALQCALHPEGEAAMARAAAASGSVMCVSTISTLTPDEIAASAPAGVRWFQLYAQRDRGLTRAIVDAAGTGGFGALVLTVDSPVIGKRDRAIRSAVGAGPPLTIPLVSELVGRTVTAGDLSRETDPGLTWADVERIVSDTPLPLVLKGVLTTADAVRACEVGAAAIVVSNHGGRQLDRTPATIDVLPEIVDAVEGRTTVLVDSGIRRGTDVLVALALGAAAVMVGRPALWALAADGEAGVRRMFEIFRRELELALTLAGAPSLAHVTADLVRRRVS